MNDIGAVVAQLSPSKKMFRALRELDRSELNISAGSKGKNDISSLLKESTPSSIHLSEFDQPPESTSTPFHGVNYFNKQSQTTFKLKIPVHVHGMSHGYRDSVSSFDSTNPSPSPQKSRLLRKRDFSQMIDPFNSNTIHYDKSLSLEENEDKDEGKDEDESMLFADSMKHLKTSTPQKSILKNSTQFSISSSGRSGTAKRVRIDDNVRLISQSNDFTSVLVSKKRPISKESSSSDYNGVTPKRIKLRHKVNPNASYADMIALCGDEQDPLNIITNGWKS